jgi:predicted ATPase
MLNYITIRLPSLVSAMIQNAEIVIVENFDSYDAGSKKVLVRLLRICLSLGQKLIITSTIAPELKLDNPSIVQSLHLQPYTPSEAKTLY